MSFFFLPLFPLPSPTPPLFSLSLPTLTRDDQRRGAQHPPRHRLLQHQAGEDDVGDELHAAERGEQRLRREAERDEVEDVPPGEQRDAGLPLAEGAGGAGLELELELC